MQRATPGDKHPDTLSSMNNVAMLLRDQGKLAEAEALFLAAVRVRQATLDDEHPRALSSLNNLVALLRAQSEPAEAEPL